MRINRASLSETALHFNISAVSTIWTWERTVEEKGVAALFNRRGRPKVMTAMNDQNKGKNEDPSELVKLQHENQMLRIENEYLKKLRALIQEPADTDKSKRK
jgi:transposase